VPERRVVVVGAPLRLAAARRARKLQQQPLRVLEAALPHVRGVGVGSIIAVGGGHGSVVVWWFANGWPCRGLLWPFFTARASLRRAVKAKEDAQG
jgi:hypothetical protein